MKAIIITIGDELLYGDTIDTNAAWLGKELTKIGVSIVGRITTGDSSQAIIDALNDTKKKADLVFLTGGLGPTNDDKTKDVLSAYFNTPLVLNKNLKNKVEDYYTSRGRSTTEVTDKMVYLPERAIVIENNYGVAPGLWIEDEQVHFIALPGIPSEMKGIMAEEIIPRLLHQFNFPSVQHRYFLTAGKGETVLANRLAAIETGLPENINMAYLPSFSRVIIRLSGFDEDKKKLADTLDHLANQIRPLLNDVLFSENINENIVHAIARLSKDKNFKIGLAESCTGGNVMHEITSVAGSSSFFEGGFVTYSNKMKVEQLGVKQETLENYGAVSEQTVKEMVEGTLSKIDCDYALAVSGIAGPSGGSVDKPVGTVCFAVGNQNQIITKTFTFAKQRDKNIKLATMVGLNLMFRFIQQNKIDV